MQRAQLLSVVVEMILRLRSRRILRIAVDGVDGASKTVFADELADAVRPAGLLVIRASVDGFHHPKNIRYRLGRNSPEGFFRDSYDYAALKSVLLDPRSPGGSARYRTATFDVENDSAVVVEERLADPDAILILDGIFLHRSELRDYWDLSIFLHVPFEISIPRGAGRGFGSADPQSEQNRRYIDGQKLYFRECDPSAHATVVVDNTDLADPRIIS
jgi:uridine kinase